MSCGAAVRLRSHGPEGLGACVVRVPGVSEIPVAAWRWRSAPLILSLAGAPSSFLSRSSLLSIFPPCSSSSRSSSSCLTGLVLAGFPVLQGRRLQGSIAVVVRGSTVVRVLRYSRCRRRGRVVGRLVGVWAGRGGRAASDGCCVSLRAWARARAAYRYVLFSRMARFQVGESSLAWSCGGGGHACFASMRGIHRSVDADGACPRRRGVARARVI